MTPEEKAIYKVQVDALYTVDHAIQILSNRHSHSFHQALSQGLLLKILR
jgi:hypothetical protein